MFEEYPTLSIAENLVALIYLFLSSSTIYLNSINSNVTINNSYLRRFFTFGLNKVNSETIYSHACSSHLSALFFQ